MKLDRFRAPALAATAVLLISGAGVAFAGSPAPSTPAPVVQQGDQTTPDTTSTTTGLAPAAESSVESATEPTTESATTESATTESANDGPGGHVDADGTNVDHQFDGQE